MLRIFLLVVGLLTLGLIVWHIGPGNIYDTAAHLGPVALLVMLIPSIIMYAVEAYGWKVTLGPLGKDIPFWRVLMIRTAGEVVNTTTPAGYVGGEPLKAALLRKHHVPMEEAFTSVIIAKTTMTIAEVVFILLGISLGVWLLGGSDSSGQIVAAAILSVGLLALGTGAFVFVQRQGLCIWLLESLRKIGVKIKYLEAREEQLRSLDRAILEFYRQKRPAFYTSTGLFFLGWMAEALEVYVILYFLGGPAMALSAISIGALSVFIKSSTFFIPGSLGAQDGGNLLLLEAFGYSGVTGITFALVRRFRELVWIGVGLLCLTLVGGKKQFRKVVPTTQAMVPNPFSLPPLDSAEVACTPVLRKAHFWQRNARVSLNERQRDMLNRVLDGFKGNLTAGKWAVIATCSIPTAQRDIKELIDQGLLVRNEGESENTSYSIAAQ
ncbi:MAG TPA: flippase-like domain-containing protein [Nitrospiraceae bacterium]|nr:flippase-like domain-containing protein [Nitrospiraceae bacterium]